MPEQLIRKSEKGNIEPDHHPEVAHKASRRLEVLGITEDLRTAGSRREFFCRLPNEAYKRMLGYINSITRNQPIEFDYEGGFLLMEALPEKDEREPLMNETFDTVRNILSNEDLDNTTALRFAALTFAGAINYIHPYKNGNGRVGRVMHYLMEFGNERGDKAMAEELYAIIAKLPMYDTDRAYALYDTPPDELDIALHGFMAVNHTVDEREINKESYAAAKIRIFLQMMQGLIFVPTQKDIKIYSLIDVPANAVASREIIPAGQIDGRSLYIKEYLNHSTIPYRKPGEIPEGGKRVIPRRSTEPVNLIHLPIDIVN